MASGIVNPSKCSFKPPQCITTRGGMLRVVDGADVSHACPDHAPACGSKRPMVYFMAFISCVVNTMTTVSPSRCCPRTHLTLLAVAS